MESNKKRGLISDSEWGTYKKAPVLAHRGKRSNSRDLGGLETFRPLLHFKLNLIAFIEHFEPITNDGLVVHEDVFTGRTLDEAVPFGAVEPLDCSLFHRNMSFRKV